MFNQLFLFEWRYFTRQPSFYITGSIFFALAFLSPAAEMSSAGNILKNGPFLVAFVMLFLGIFSLFLVVNFVADTALRDSASEMEEVLYSKPVSSVVYQLGRFFGAFAVTAVVFSLVPVGLILGSLMPWVEESRMGAFDLQVYLRPFLFFSVPTLFTFSCIFYALAIRLKSMASVYFSAVAIILLNEISDSLFASPDMRFIGALLDPFGFKAFDEVTRYWSVEDKNFGQISLLGTVLFNRLIWLSVGIGVLLGFGRITQPLQLKRIAAPKLINATEDGPAALQSDQIMSTKGRLHAHGAQFWTRLVFETRQVVFDPTFYIMVFSVLVLMLLAIAEPKGMFGNSFWPVTQDMVQMIRLALNILVLVFIIYYSATVVWREQSVQLSEIIDSMPVSNLSFFLSKLLSVCVVILLLVGITVLVSVLYQLAQGYERLELGQYLISLLYFTALPWLMMTVLAFLFQVISNNKYTGMLLFVLFIVSDYVLAPMGFSHNLFRFAHSSLWMYSDMNGYGHALTSHGWYMLYWGSLSVTLATIGYGLWRRGQQQTLLQRIAALSYQLMPKDKVAIAISMAVFVGSGMYIYYNTIVLNHYVDQQQIDQIHAEYEIQYQQFTDQPIPDISRINAFVDIYPSQKKVAISADMEFTNNSKRIINDFLVTLPGHNPILDQRIGFSPVDYDLRIEGGALASQTGPLNTRWFRFATPLQPGETRQGTFTSIRQQTGFSEKAPSIRVLDNGTFFQNNEIFPLLGFIPRERLYDPAKRTNFSLPPLQRAQDLDNPDFRQQSISSSILGINGSYLEFETTVSTDADQQVLTSGTLQKQWLDGDRRYFHYKMDAPIQNYFAYFSGKYSNDIIHHNGIDVGVYYIDEHKMNIERIQQSVTDAIDYYSESFGPFQHQYINVVEFPGPANFGQDFPNIIAYSERAGFIHDQRDPTDNDQVYWFIAHEVAHQWWGAQVDGANVQGGTLLGETLAQYSAFMLIKRKYGDRRLRAMLKYELDRYLIGRGGETRSEMPLYREENQAYLHYNKGSLAMMALAEKMGETRLNQALMRFLNAHKFAKNDYPTTRELFAAISRDATIEERHFIQQSFFEINLFDLAIVSAEAQQLDSGEYEVIMTIGAAQVADNGHGVQSEQAFSEYVDVALFTGNPEDKDTDTAAVYSRKHLLKSGENQIVFKVDKLPKFAVVDPAILFIDRDIGNNTLAF